MKVHQHVSNFILHPSSFILFESFLVKIYQFHRRRGGFKTLVSQLDAGAIDCLVHRVGSYDPENNRHSSFQSRLRDIPRVTSLAMYSKCGV